MSGPARVGHASTRAVLLDLIRAAGMISRVGLVNASGLTGGTISTVVRGLIDEGLVVETGHAESTGGKRRVMLQLNHFARYAVGVHLDDARITYVLTNLGGAVVARISRAGAGTEQPAEVVARMAREVDALIDSVGVERDRILGLGLVAPGPLGPVSRSMFAIAGPEAAPGGTAGRPTYNTGMRAVRPHRQEPPQARLSSNGTSIQALASGHRLTPPSMRHWDDYEFDHALARATGLPLVLDNDATAAAIGEHWSGGVGATSTFAALYMGTGVGAGVVLGGTTYRGPSGNAGEIGHTCLDVAGPRCWCGARGCLEVLAGPAAVVAQARADRALSRAAGLVGGRTRAAAPVSADFAAIARAARRGNARALALLERSAAYLAAAARTLANVMDLEVLVLTGPGFAIAGSVYLPVLRAELDSAFFARDAHPISVRLSPAAASAPAIGAAAIVLQSELVPRQQGLDLPDDLAAEEPPVFQPTVMGTRS